MAFKKGVPHSEEHKQKLRAAAALRSKDSYPGGPKGLIPWNKGVPTSEEARKKMSESKIKAGIKPPSRVGFKGSLNTNWKGGKTPPIQMGRYDLGATAWRKSVLERDGYKCMRCKSEKNLVIHHIKEWIQFPDLRFDMQNSETLCKKCHVNEHLNRKKRVL